MAVVFLEPGGDADFGIGLWTTQAGTPAVATDFVHGGHIKSIKYRPANNDILRSPASVADAGGRVSVWIFLHALPTGGDSVLFGIFTTTPASVVRVAITTGGVLKFTTSAGTQLGTNGSTLSTGTWYRLSFEWVITSKTVYDLRLFKNGSLDISVTNGTSLGNNNSAYFIIGNWDTDASLDFRSSDHYQDNSNALTDPGNIWVTAKRPNANGTTNGFTTQIGSGGSGYGTGHSPQVNERPNSDSNGWSLSLTTKTTEEYNIEAANAGDIDISAATIVDYMGWIRTSLASTLDSPVDHIILNGTATAKTLTTSAAFYTQVAGSTSYPAGTGTDIGMDAQYTTNPHLVSLYEAGVVVAYIPSSTTTSTSVTTSTSTSSTTTSTSTSVTTSTSTSTTTTSTSTSVTTSTSTSTTTTSTSTSVTTSTSTSTTTTSTSTSVTTSTSTSSSSSTTNTGTTTSTSSSTSITTSTSVSTSSSTSTTTTVSLFFTVTSPNQVAVRDEENNMPLTFSVDKPNQRAMIEE